VTLARKSIIGKIVEKKFGDEIFLAIETPHEPNDAILSFRLGQDFLREFLGKSVKITIEEV